MMDEELIKFQSDCLNLLIKEPFFWQLSTAVDYASRLAIEYFLDDRSWTAKDALLEDIQYWGD